MTHINSFSIMSRIRENLQGVHARIDAVARKVSRDRHDILLLAVSKTFGAASVIEAVEVGVCDFGENYVQEALDKMEEVKRLRNHPGASDSLKEAVLTWHFIGPVQSNKTRLLAASFDWVHSVEREKIAARLSEQRPPGMMPLNVCIQVNICREASKSGALPEDVPALARAIVAMPRLRLRGLMAIPPVASGLEAQRQPFQALREVLYRVQQQGIAVDTLSMGMSADLEAAICEGATIVRVGSAVFGERNDGH
ncbi:MAG: YggS family pyridoxal phosphate-dependent enzyme [Burkholderiaceae bacterium]